MFFWQDEAESTQCKSSSDSVISDASEDAISIHAMVQHGSNKEAIVFFPGNFEGGLDKGPAETDEESNNRTIGHFF